MNNSIEIDYSDYYVAFLDVLGFKNLVNSKKPEDKQKINDYFNLIKEITDDLKKIQSKKDIGAIIISDSVILSVPIGIDQSEKIHNLRELCIAIQKIQFKLAEKNIWLRGAISSGEAYFSSQDSQVIGPAYINAYLLEERLAIHPRVILDNKIITDLNLSSAQELINYVNNSETCSQEYDLQQRNVLFKWKSGGIEKEGLKKDVALFVDYLAYAFEDESKLESIVKNLEKCIYMDNGVYSKFRWVTDYLLANCRYFNQMPCNIDSHVLIKQFERLLKL